MREPYEFAAWLAAERSGLPMVVHAIGAVTGSPVLFAARTGPVAVPAGPSRPAARLPDPRHGVQHHPGPGPHPRRRGRRPGRGGPGHHRPDRRPALLGLQPAHVHAARFIPQHDVLAAAAAVVCHAGVGTVYGALSAGVPLVVAPLAADQPICAMGCVLAGVAESLAPVLPPQQVLDSTTDPTAVTAAQVSQATTRVLETPTYRQAAQRIAAEIAAAPPPSTILPWLTSLAGNG